MKTDRTSSKRLYYGARRCRFVPTEKRGRMPKRCASPSVSPSKASRTSEEEGSHQRKVAVWESVQEHVRRAVDVPYAGMVSAVDVEKSYQDHKKRLQDAGYAFGTYNTDRSLFEKLDCLVFQRVPADHMGRTVFSKAKSILSQINEGSKPERNTFSMLVMMSTEYIVPMANMVHLLAHPSATADDLDLFWELTDRLWCFAHPIYTLHSGYLDETCDKITARLRAVAE